MATSNGSEAGSADDLGPVLDTGATNHGVAILVLVVGIVVAAFGGLMLIQNEATRPPLAVSAALIAAGLAALAVSAALFWTRRGALTLHEQGLRRRVGGQEIAMRFDEADQVAFFTIRLVANHVYTATDEKLAIKAAGPGGRALSFERRFKDPSGTMGPSPAARLAEPLIARIAARNEECLARGESVPWFPGATIHDRGVDLPNGWGGTVTVRWEELEEPEISNRLCRIRRVGKSAPVASVLTSRMNFWPGLEIVRRRRVAAHS